ncbi:hypothetical protein GOODEAATRI_008907 [Goodea atripinnis]|uniref:trypsin n=1 Tax=Goodea atripinnis TaxID=208336 RepID=A0ABV0NIN0_9TELE
MLKLVFPVYVLFFSEYISRKNETRTNREHLETKLFCGIPNRDVVKDTKVEERGRTIRRKRVVGGLPANPIQWQVALEENRRIDCGGAYIGGCWVLTAAHCVSYVPATYENDIALIKLEKLPFMDKCLEDNPGVRAVCVPWTTQLFQPNHTCSISGWGRTAGTNITVDNKNVSMWSSRIFMEYKEQKQDETPKSNHTCLS